MRNGRGILFMEAAGALLLDFKDKLTEKVSSRMLNNMETLNPGDRTYMTLREIYAGRTIVRYIRKRACHVSSHPVYVV